MSALTFLSVPEHVARNPVAQSIERYQLRKAAQLFATRALGMAEGEECEGDLYVTARSVRWAIEILAARGMSDDTLNAAMEAIEEMDQAGCRWMPKHAPLIDAALMQVEDVAAQATVKEKQAAYVKVSA